MRGSPATAPLAALAAALVTLATATPALAQQTRADSAAVLLQTARNLNAQNQRDAAQSLLDYIRRNFAGTPAAASADSLLGGVAVLPEPRGGGRTHLIVWSTLHGAALGIAIPAMLGSDAPQAYGLGLMVGGPAGFAAAKAWADQNAPSSGRAAAMTFGFSWGAWQAIGWRALFNIGNHVECTPAWGGGSWCNETSGRSPWTALVLGGAGGLLAGAALGRNEPPAGLVAFASHGAYWGTFYGIVGVSLANTGGDAAMATILLAGDAGLVLGAVAAPRNVTAGQVRQASALGIAGIVAGLGADLIIQPDNDRTAILVPAVAGTFGLISGWKEVTRPARRTNGGANQIRFGRGIPQPAPVLSGLRPDGRPVYRTALRIPLLEASF